MKIKKAHLVELVTFTSPPDQEHILPEKLVIPDAPQDCPLRHLLDRMGDKWSLLIIAKLAEAPACRRRFSELMRAIAHISKRMLATTLRNLERDGLVTRDVFAEIPLRVEYQLTERGKSFLVPTRTLIVWVEKNWPEIEISRRQYDQSARK